MLPAVLTLLTAPQVGTPTTMSFTRRGARSVVVTYEVTFSARIGKLTGAMTAELEEKPDDASTARFTVRNVRTRQGREEWTPWTDTRERTWTGEFLSARSLFGIQAETGKVGTVVTIDADDPGETRLPIESVLPLGGKVNVLGIVAQRSTLRGQVDFILLGSRRSCDVEAQFDPNSGRPVRFTLQTVASSNPLEPEITLNIRAAGTA